MKFSARGLGIARNFVVVLTVAFIRQRQKDFGRGDKRVYMDIYHSFIGHLLEIEKALFSAY